MIKATKGEGPVIHHGGSRGVTQVKSGSRGERPPLYVAPDPLHGYVSDDHTKVWLDPDPQSKAVAPFSSPEAQDQNKHGAMRVEPQ